MTTRERWIVYPLLMFSLMMGIWPRYFHRTFMLKADRIECDDIAVTRINGRPAKLTAFIPVITRPAANATTGRPSDKPVSQAPQEEDRDKTDEIPTNESPAVDQLDSNDNTEASESPDINDEGNDAS